MPFAKKKSNDKAEPSANKPTTTKTSDTKGISPASDKKPVSFWNAFQSNVKQNDKELRNGAEALFFVQNELTRVGSSNVSSPQKRREERLQDDDDDVTTTSSSASQNHHRRLPQRWVDFFCIVGLSKEQQREKLFQNEDSSISCTPSLLDRFPKQNYEDMVFPEHLPVFCFPNGYTVLRRKKGKTHNIPEPALCQMVLTSAAGHRLYMTLLTVYERIDSLPISDSSKHKAKKPKTTTPPADDDNQQHCYWVPKCLLLLSHHPFYHAQSTLLKELYYTVASGASPIPMERYIAHALYHVPFPTSKRALRNVVEWQSWTGAGANGRRASFRLESPSRNTMTSLEPLFRTLSLSNILVIWATLLQEGKVVLQCTHTALLTPICEGLLQLLFPFEWQGIYIPVLPMQNSQGMDILEAPVPYLIGIATAGNTLNNDTPRLYQPGDVLWCDLDTDVLHLGYTEDGGFVETLPILPDKIMLLKVQLEELADPLYLPSMEGIKGQMTTGDRSCKFENGLREPYALRTRLFDKPSTQAFSRSYILSQSSKVPPRGKVVQTSDFIVAREEGNSYSDLFCCFAESSQSCAPTEDADKENSAENARDSVSTNTTGRKSNASSMGNSFARSSRQMQAHTDRLMALFAHQQYATPSSHASKASQDQQFTKDALKHQDEIAARFFETTEVDLEIAEQVRTCVLNFFITFLSRYDFYVHSSSGRLDVNRFLSSLRLPRDQQAFVKAVITSQMFDLLLHDPKRKEWFDVFILRTQRRGGHGHNNDNTPEAILSVPPPCGAGIIDGVMHCQDRRFPDVLNDAELIASKTVPSIWETMCGGDTHSPTKSPEKVSRQNKTHQRQKGSSWYQPWFLSMLVIVMLVCQLPSSVDGLTTHPFSTFSSVQRHAPKPTQQMYKPSTVDEEPFVPTNDSFAAVPLERLFKEDHFLDYDFAQEFLTIKKFNTDLHDVTFRESPMKGLQLLQKMETLYEQFPNNSSLVQPDSYSYATVIEGCCQERQRQHSDGVSEVENAHSTASTAQELLQRMEREERLLPSALMYLFVCQKWAEESQHSKSPRKAMQNAEKVVAAYKRQVMQEQEGSEENSGQDSLVYPARNLASFYAVIVDGYSKLPGIIPEAMQRAEHALEEMEKSRARDQDRNEAALTDVQEATRTMEGAYQSSGPSSLAYSSFIVGISRSKQRDMAQKADSVLQRMKRNGAQPDMVVYTSVLNCWANAISKEERSKAPSRTMSLLQEMEDAYTAENNYLLKPNQITYSQAIKAIRRSQDPNVPAMAEGILNRMYNLTASGRIQVPPNAVNYNSVIAALTTNGPRSKKRSNAQKAEAMLVEMMRRARHEGEFPVEPDVFTWGSVMRAWADCGSSDSGEQAQRILDKFEQLYESGNSRIRPNVVCYTTVMQAWARGNASPKVTIQKVNDLLARLEQSYMESGKDFLRPNDVTYITVMDAYSRKYPEKAGSLCQAVVDHMLQLHEKGFGFRKPTRIVFNQLINAWSRSPEENAAEHAEQVFQLMGSENQPGVQDTRHAELDERTRPDEISLVGVLNAWANNAINGGAMRAQQIMEYTTNELTTADRGFDHSIVSWNVLIKAWGRSREHDSVQRAETILTDLEENYKSGKSKIRPDLTTYSSVINCAAYYSGPPEGKAAAFKVAWRTFTKLEQANDLVANNIVYGTLFKAIGKLHRPDAKREHMIRDVFGQCCLAGQVCGFVLSQLRSASPKKLFRQLILKPCSLKDRDANNMDKILRSMPKSWSKNVAY